MALAVEPTPSDELVAMLLSVDVDKLAARERVYRPDARWVVFDEQTPVGLALALTRPDNRLFLTLRLEDEAGFGPLLAAAVSDLDAPIYLSIADDQHDRLKTAEAAGFSIEIRTDNFDVPFETALARTAGRPTGRVELLRADQVAREELFLLDIELRQDVPGCEGWRGDRRWFDDEMTGPMFEPEGYLVARDSPDGELVGLCRMWNHAEKPTLGLIAVRRTHRSGLPARALLHKTLLVASAWGSATFSAHTAHRSLQRRLRSSGATRTGGTYQLVNRP